jgi:hypothetical protein
MIKAYSRTQEGYTDEGLYNLFSVSRAEILKQKFEKLTYIPEDNWFQFCMKLQIDKSHNCDCVPDKLECKILKSSYKIPQVITGMNTSKLRISTIGGKAINLITEAEWRRKKLKEPTMYYGSLINSHLIIWNAPLNLKAILISGVWSDLLDLQNIPNCSTTGEEQATQCFNPLTTEYPLQAEYSSAVYMKVLSLLNISLQLPQDQTNDSNEFIKM